MHQVRSSCIRIWSMNRRKALSGSVSTTKYRKYRPATNHCVIHGGGWISGSKEHARGYFKLLAAQGYNVVSVQYQFALKPFIQASYIRLIRPWSLLLNMQPNTRLMPKIYIWPEILPGRIWPATMLHFNKSRLCQTIGFSALSATFPA